LVAVFFFCPRVLHDFLYLDTIFFLFFLHNESPSFSSSFRSCDLFFLLVVGSALLPSFVGFLMDVIDLLPPPHSCANHVGSVFVDFPFPWPCFFFHVTVFVFFCLTPFHSAVACGSYFPLQGCASPPSFDLAVSGFFFVFRGTWRGGGVVVLFSPRVSVILDLVQKFCFL